MACALAASKLHIPVAHVEAGLRSFDRTMPEEINRIVTDAVADCLLVSEPDGIRNLRTEGHPASHLHLTGNVMIDTLRELLPRAQVLDTLAEFRLQPGKYGLVTLHRPGNVDAPETLSSLVQVLVRISRGLKLVFVTHPRTSHQLDKFGLRTTLDQAKEIISLPPLGYLAFLNLSSQAKLIITDSGGLQEESTALGIPCLTLRASTERPITVTEGTSTLVGNDTARLECCIAEVLGGTYKAGCCPALWDGAAATRIAEVLACC
jgi:UDP-N-acetylglucosamine 2-epimerase (non-hydrolysing)